MSVAIEVVSRPVMPSSSGATKDAVVVVGAGIVGLSIALRLLMKGHLVHLVDPNDPASGCSSGNAGYLSEANIYPAASTDTLLKVPRMLFNPLAPLSIQPTYLPKFIPWAVRAAFALRPKRLERTVSAMAKLIKPAIASYELLLKEAHAEKMIEQRGSLAVCSSSSSLDERSSRIPALLAQGIAAERVNAGQVKDLEPEIASDISGGVFYPNSARCLHPQLLGNMFADALRAGGVEITRASVKKMLPLEGGRWSLITDGKTINASKVVVAAGRWSDDLLKPLGYSVPLISERGYHLMLPDSGVCISRPVLFAEDYFVATPMMHGLRLAGTAEFACANTPMKPERADSLFKLANRHFSSLSRRNAARWMGVRPSLPDGVPAIGRASKHVNLFYCFGHGYNGLMTAAISSELVASFIGDETPPFDVAPYSIDRFSSWLN